MIYNLKYLIICALVVAGFSADTEAEVQKSQWKTPPKDRFHEGQDVEVAWRLSPGTQWKRGTVTGIVDDGESSSCGKRYVRVYVAPSAGETLRYERDEDDGFYKLTGLTDSDGSNLTVHGSYKIREFDFQPPNAHICGTPPANSAAKTPIQRETSRRRVELGEAGNTLVEEIKIPAAGRMRSIRQTLGAKGQHGERTPNHERSPDHPLYEPAAEPAVKRIRRGGSRSARRSGSVRSARRSPTSARPVVPRATPAAPPVAAPPIPPVAPPTPPVDDDVTESNNNLRAAQDRVAELSIALFTVQHAGIWNEVMNATNVPDYQRLGFTVTNNGVIFHSDVEWEVETPFEIDGATIEQLEDHAEILRGLLETWGRLEQDGTVDEAYRTRHGSDTPPIAPPTPPGAPRADAPADPAIPDASHPATPASPRGKKRPLHISQDSDTSSTVENSSAAAPSMLLATLPSMLLPTLLALIAIVA